MTDTKKCKYVGCTLEATTTAVGRNHTSTDYNDDDDNHPYIHWHPILEDYCDAHAMIVASEGDPAYIACCPNCQCRFGLH